jgi:hypothetical protein
MIEIGADISKRLDVIPAQYRVIGKRSGTTLLPSLSRR